MDLVDNYIREESDHIPSLLKCLKNPDSKEQDECFSNLFNFQVDFQKNQVVIEDDCGMFCNGDHDKDQVCQLAELIQRLETKRRKTQQ